ncbi:MAG: glycosyl transferase family 2 [Edaphobacter sp.]|nr:glycosyl transferase family 2 [Edaphobacter sp.]
MICAHISCGQQLDAIRNFSGAPAAERPSDYWTSMKDLSIIIVNWNSLEFAKNCIASIYSTVEDLDFEVIVVDNASQDGACQSLIEAFPSMKFVMLRQNVGFGQANTLGMKYSNGRNLLFLNPDTLVLERAISRMVFELEAAPDIGAVGCRLLNGDRSLQTSCIQSFPTLCNQLFGVDWFKRRWPRLQLWGMRALYVSSPDGLHDVEVVSGACLMVKRQVFEEVGCFNLDYFMYAEEVDLCYSIHCAGWRIVHIADAQIVHFGGQSTKKRGSSFSDIVMRDSVFKFLRRHRGRSYASLYRAGLFVSAITRLSVLTVLSPLTIVPNRLISREAVVCASRKWVNIARWSLALEEWTKQLGESNSNTAAPAKK